MPSGAAVSVSGPRSAFRTARPSRLQWRGLSRAGTGAEACTSSGGGAPGRDPGRAGAEYCREGSAQGDSSASQGGRAGASLGLKGRLRTSPRVLIVSGQGDFPCQCFLVKNLFMTSGPTFKTLQTPEQISLPGYRSSRCSLSLDDGPVQSRWPRREEGGGPRRSPTPRPALTYLSRASSPRALTKPLVSICPSRST